MMSLYLLFLISLFLPTHSEFSPSSYVESIIWSKFKAGLPSDDTSVLGAKILANTNRYSLLTWYPKTYENQTDKYLNLGVDQNAILPPADEAFALAIAIKTGAYNATIAGKSVQEALHEAVRMIISIAHKHTSNTEGKGKSWGYGWQTALWAHYTGFAGWLLWEHLEEIDKDNVARMVIKEADRFINYTVPYYQDKSGKVLFPGDTKAEENGWDANVIQLATAMMPHHPNWRNWMRKNIELVMSSYARPQDLHNETMYHGAPVHKWLNGSNIFENGTAVNHNKIHPDYMALVLYNVGSSWMYALAGQPTPLAAFRQADLVYHALVDLKWPSPPWSKPGGNIYVHDNKTNIYYPQPDDWGTGLRMHFAYLDSQAELFHFDNLVSIKAKEWSKAHSEIVYTMQSRFSDGRTYGDNHEYNSFWREPWVAFYAAANYLQRWIMHQGPIMVTNQPYW